MATITTRAGKGSPLTNAEVDANFTNLNDDKATALKFAVVNNGASAYTFDGTGTDSDDNPTLYLYRGFTYEFNVNASGHPFYVKTVAGTGTANQYTDNVTNNGVQVGTLTWEVQMDAPDTLYYQCSVHAAMVGTIVILDRDENMKSFADTFTLPTTDGTAGQALVTDANGTIAFGDVDSLPDQSGNDGYFLTTDGSTASWAEVQSNRYTSKTIGVNTTLSANTEFFAGNETVIADGVTLTVPADSILEVKLFGTGKAL